MASVDVWEQLVVGVLQADSQPVFFLPVLSNWGVNVVQTACFGIFDETCLGEVSSTPLARW